MVCTHKPFECNTLSLCLQIILIHEIARIKNIIPVIVPTWSCPPFRTCKGTLLANRELFHSRVSLPEVPHCLLLSRLLLPLIRILSPPCYHYTRVAFVVAMARVSVSDRKGLKAARKAGAASHRSHDCHGNAMGRYNCLYARSPDSHDFSRIYTDT